MQRDRNRRTAVRTKQLFVYVRIGRNLPNRDLHFLFGESDPYVRVEAVDVQGTRIRYQTRFIPGSNNPDWYQLLDGFGRRSWEYIEISCWDHDGILGDDLIMIPERFYVRPGVHQRRHCESSSCHTYVLFDYYLLFV